MAAGTRRVGARPRGSCTRGWLHRWLRLSVAVAGVALLRPAGLSGQAGVPADPSRRYVEPAAPEAVDSLSVVDDGVYFYDAADYGSTASFGPLSFILNRGLHFGRAKHGSVDVTGIPNGWETLSTAVRRPVWAVEQGGGFRHWARTQVFPLRWDRGAAWTVNYTGHLIEAGVGLRTMWERLEVAGVPHARLWAHLSVLASSALAELYEASERQEAFASHVADVYIFEPAGHLLFSIDGVARFFGESLNTRLWPHQVAVSVTTGEILNTGLDMVMKIPLPTIERFSLFVRMGMGSDVGLTLHRPGGWDYSLALGFAATDPTTDPLNGDELVQAVLAGSFFIDRNGSLMASIHGTRGRGRNLTINLYPGALGFLPDDVGAFLVVTRSNALQFGISHRALMGVGLGR